VAALTWAMEALLGGSWRHSEFACCLFENSFIFANRSSSDGTVESSSELNGFVKCTLSIGLLDVSP
jgi:hypothetical protein